MKSTRVSLPTVGYRSIQVDDHEPVVGQMATRSRNDRPGQPPTDQTAFTVRRCLLTGNMPHRGVSAQPPWAYHHRWIPHLRWQQTARAFVLGVLARAVADNRHTVSLAGGNMTARRRMEPYCLRSRTNNRRKAHGTSRQGAECHRRRRVSHHPNEKAALKGGLHRARGCYGFGPAPCRISDLVVARIPANSL